MTGFAFFNSFAARPPAIFLCLEGLIIPMPYLILLLTSSLPGFASSYIACLVSGPPGPSKSLALVGLETSELRLKTKFLSGCSTYWPDPPFSPGFEIKSPPSSTGISRLSPAPDAAEPTFMVLPGNFSVTLVSTPDSVARSY